MTRTDTIHRRADGSIDTAHYMDHARELRSRELQVMLAGARRRLRRFICAQQDRLATDSQSSRRGA